MSPEAEKQEEGGTASITIKHNNNDDKNNNNTEKGKKNNKKNDNKEKEKEKQEWDPMVPFFSMFRYAERFDKFLMIVASLAAVANGAIQPTFSILLGEINDVFTAEKFTDPNYKLEDAITPFCLWFIYMGIAAFVLSYMETGMWMLCGERQIRKVRENYLRAVLRQEIGWFDVSQPSQVSARIAADTAVMQEAIGWQLTLIILAVSPLLGIAGFFMSKVLSSMNKQGLDAYAGAGGVAEECISNMRTVTMFNGHRREAERYALKLIRALAVGMKKGFATGIGVGLLMLIVFGTYALAFWYGAKLVSDGTKNATTGKPWTGGDVISTFFAVLSGSFAIGQAGPALGIFAAGRAAAFKIFAIIERKSKIDPFDPSGEKLDEVHGDIEFRDVVFSYPSRQDVQVLRGLNLLIPQGKTVALVGESGCGKSTTISLLEKFYLADQGQVFLDGVDVKNINTKWLRQNLGLVSQEPQLFATSIAENIRFGKEDATLQEIIEASKAANAHSFIDRLPQGYDTLVGEKGLQMSGGQKQRIAIARAIIKNPKIILLDEATSALDTANERLVQEALDRMMIGRTTIVIAHRLATVKNADKIVVFKEGTVLEEGVHSELMALDGLYAKLVHRQTRKLAWEPTEPALDPNRIQSPIDTLASKPWGGAPMLSPLATMRRQLTRRASSFFLEPSDDDEGATNVSFWRLAKESKPEIVAFLFGLLAASINGTMYPIFAIIYGEIVSTLNNPDPKEMMSDAEFLALMFLARAVAAGIANFFQVYCFAIVGEKLTFRLRYYSFTSILRQNIGWFDDTKNSTGILSTKLATDATLVQGVTTQRVATLFQNVATIVAGLIIAFISGWKLSLVILAVMPCFILSSSFEMKFMKGFSKDAKTAYETAGMVSAEAVGGIRTVASFSNEEKLLAMYCAKLDEPMKVAVRRAHVSGLGFGASQFCTYAINCLAYWYGSRLVDSHEWHVSQSEINSQCSASSLDLDVCTRLVFANKGLQQLTKVFMAIFMSGMSLGQTSQMAPDAAKASTAAESIYSLIDRKSPIDPETVGQSKQAIFGNIAFKNVHFHYPTRPNIRIFRGLDLFAPAGATLALVGDSGGGKSTVLSLIERFYDPIRGTIYLDGIDIKTYDIQFLRSQIAFVSQEPSLFANSIAKNIAYGKPDATLDQIEAAAKMANCHNFITELPDGYNTMLGDKHTQLSGGQKQRVAIARAILMNPKVLLLDEATSALDSESEALVQEALEKLMCGRTTIVIAHRLSTIVNSDLIAVMKGGRIAEVGSHQDLMSFGGAYASLVSGQL